MSVTYRNDDFVLQVLDEDAAVSNIVNKYDAFLEALSGEHYAFQTEAIKFYAGSQAPAWGPK